MVIKWRLYNTRGPESDIIVRDGYNSRASRDGTDMYINSETMPTRQLKAMYWNKWERRSFQMYNGTNNKDEI